MFMTTVEAHLTEPQSAVLQAAFADEPRPEALLHTYLAQDTKDPTLWRAIGIWLSREAFDAYRATVPVPGGLVMFRNAGVEPVVSMFEIRDSFSK